MDYINDRQNFIDASKKCGKCGCKYSSARDASDCITRKHGLVRCYLCFKLFKAAEQLFIHYGRSHRQSGQLDSLECGFCSKSVRYKSVSTHVISHHLMKKNGTTGSKRTVPMPTDGHGSGLTDEDEDQPEPKSIPKKPKVTCQNLTLNQLRAAVKNCSQCGDKFSSAALASACIAKHNLLRCYLCLKLKRNTEQLFKHFRLAHEEGEKSGSIRCSFCRLTVKYKSVSTHIISRHLVDRMQVDGEKGNEDDDKVKVKPKFKEEKANADGGMRLRSSKRQKLG